MPVCVGALMLRLDDTTRILLGKRAVDRTSWPGVWDIPGGHSDLGETPEQTLIRELQEELGVTPITWRLVDVFQVPLGDCDEPLVLHLYAVTVWDGTLYNRLPEEHAEIAWFDVDTACQLQLAHPSYPELFRRLMAAS